MLDQTNNILTNKAICSLLAIEIIDFSGKTLANQADIKSLLNSTISLAMVDIPQADYAIVDTLSGATIAFFGPLNDALEDALFIAITIRDEIHKNNAQTYRPLYVQFGINQGAARLTQHANAAASLVGEGVDDAKRIASFANPNQILASLDYVEMASKLSNEIAQMFDKYDMHAHHKDVFAVRLLKDKSTDDPIEKTETPIYQQLIGKTNWLSAGTGAMVLVAFFTLVKIVSAPVEPTITLVQPMQLEVPKPIAKLPEATPNVDLPIVLAEPTNTTQPDTEQLDKDQFDTEQSVQLAEVQNSQTQVLPASLENLNTDKPNKVKAVKKTAIQKTAIQKTQAQKVSTQKTAANTTTDKTVKVDESKSAEINSDERTLSSPPINTAEMQTEKKMDKNASKQKSGWQTFKDSVITGVDSKCTQAEIALNQCNK